MPIFQVVAKLLSVFRDKRIVVLMGLATLIILSGAGLFAITQHDSYWLSLYWAITTATTVGYGDVLPHNTGGRVIASAVMLTTIPIVGAVFGLLAGASAVSHLRRILGMETRLPSQPYTVIYGMHPIVPHVLDELCSRDDPVVLVAPSRPPGAHAGCRLHRRGHDRRGRDRPQPARSRQPGADRLHRRSRHDGRRGHAARDRAGPEDLRADRLAEGGQGTERARGQAHARGRGARRPHRRQESGDARGRRPVAAAGRDARTATGGDARRRRR